MAIIAIWNLENLFRPGGDFGPKTSAVYDAKLDGLVRVVDAIGPDVLAVEEVGDPNALADLVELLDGDWWKDPILRSTDCESRVVVAPGTLGGLPDGSPAGGEPGGRAERRVIRVRAPLAGGRGHATCAAAQSAANAAGVRMPSDECGRRRL